MSEEIKKTDGEDLFDLLRLLSEKAKACPEENKAFTEVQAKLDAGMNYLRKKDDIVYRNTVSDFAHLRSEGDKVSYICIVTVNRDIAKRMGYDVISELVQGYAQYMRLKLAKVIKYSRILSSALDMNNGSWRLTFDMYIDPRD